MNKHSEKKKANPLGSPHTSGRAVDLLLHGKDAFDFLHLVMQSRLMTGIGFSQRGRNQSARFIHLDDLESSSRVDHDHIYGVINMPKTAAWQRKEGKSESGGLNEKGRKSYEKENPGSDLKAPQKKGNKSEGQVSEMDAWHEKEISKKTANDPNQELIKL